MSQEASFRKSDFLGILVKIEKYCYFLFLCYKNVDVAYLRNFIFYV